MKVKTFTAEVKEDYATALASLDNRVNAFSESCRIIAVGRDTYLSPRYTKQIVPTLSRTVTYENSYDENL